MRIMFIVCKPAVKNVGAVPWLKLSMVCLQRHMLSPRSDCIGFMMNRMTHWDWFFWRRTLVFSLLDTCITFIYRWHCV